MPAFAGLLAIPVNASVGVAIDMAGPFAEHALAFRRAGLSVILTGGENGKRPAVRGFMRYAQHHAAERTIERWAEAFPSANIGIMAGAVSGLTVVDIDDADLMDQAVARFGETPVVSRGRRGFHLYYRHNGERSLNRLDGAAIDVRGAQGNPLIIAPPSVRPDTGGRWEWERGCLPDDLDKLPEVKQGSLPVVDGKPAGAVEAAREGSRAGKLFKVSLREARHCDTLDSLIDAIKTINEGYLPPLTEAEVVSTAQSAWRKQVSGENWVGQGARAVLVEGDINTLGNNVDASFLLTRLRYAHACRKGSFALSKALGESFGWGKPRFNAARNFLKDAGLIECTHKGGSGSGDPPRYRLPKMGPK